MSEINRTSGGDNRLPPDEFDELRESIKNTVISRTRLGVATNLLVRNGRMPRSNLDINSTGSMPGASLGKLPLAALLIESGFITANTEYEVPRDRIDRSGGGTFDDIDAPEAVTGKELLEDMLLRSGNTAFRILASQVKSASLIKSFYENKGWRRTTVPTAPNGYVLLGKTTPEEALNQLEAIVSGTKGDDALRKIAIGALTNNQVTEHGIRQRVDTLRPGAIVQNKTGEYTDDSEPALAYRHDVGRVKGERGEVWYAVMSSSNAIGRGVIADPMVSLIGAEIAVATGATEDYLSLGAVAFRRYVQIDRG